MIYDLEVSKHHSWFSHIMFLSSFIQFPGHILGMHVIILTYGKGKKGF